MNEYVELIATLVREINQHNTTGDLNDIAEECNVILESLGLPTIDTVYSPEDIADVAEELSIDLRNGNIECPMLEEEGLDWSDLNLLSTSLRRDRVASCNVAYKYVLRYMNYGKSEGFL